MKRRLAVVLGGMVVLAALWFAFGHPNDATPTQTHAAAEAPAPSRVPPRDGLPSRVLNSGIASVSTPSVRMWPEQKLPFTTRARHLSVRDLQWDAAIAGSPAAAAEALQWSLYCMSTYMARPTASGAESIYPIPMRWPDKVLAAVSWYYREAAAARARGEQLDEAAYQASLSPDEVARPVALSPEQAAYRFSLMEAAQSECAGPGVGAWREALLKSVKAGGSPLADLLNARQPTVRPESDDDRRKTNAIYREAIERAIREGDLPALQTWARFTSNVEVDWGGRGIDGWELSALHMDGGRLALQLALCDIAVDCSADGFAARSVCMDYGACNGATLSARLRQALGRDGLAPDVLDTAAAEIRDSIESGNLEKFNLHRRF